MVTITIDTGDALKQYMILFNIENFLQIPYLPTLIKTQDITEVSEVKITCVY